MGKDIDKMRKMFNLFDEDNSGGLSTRLAINYYHGVLEYNVA